MIECSFTYGFAYHFAKTLSRKNILKNNNIFNVLILFDKTAKFFVGIYIVRFKTA
jgi:hypothetical protein